MEKNEPINFEEYLFNVTIAATIVMGFIFFVFMSATAQPENYSAIYLKPGTHSNLLSTNEIGFVFGIQNFERRDTNYTVDIFLNEKLVEKMHVLVDRGKFQEVEKTISINPDKHLFPLKVKLFLHSPEAPQPGSTAKKTHKPFVFFWVEKETSS